MYHNSYCLGKAFLEAVATTCFPASFIDTRISFFYAFRVQTQAYGVRESNFQHTFNCYLQRQQ